MAEGAASLRLSEADVDQDPAAAVQKLTVALEEQPDNSGYYCQRAYAYILLQKYHDAITDAKKSLELDPSNAKAFLQQGIGEYHSGSYGAAMKSFSEGHKLDMMPALDVNLFHLGKAPSSVEWNYGNAAKSFVSTDKMFAIWIKRCEEALNTKSQAELDYQVLQYQSQPPKIKYDWYQTESHVIVTIMIKKAKKDDVNIQFSENELTALVRVSSEEEYRLKLPLLHSIVPEQSTFKVLSTKIEIKLKKPEAVRWEKLEGNGSSPKLKQFTPVSESMHLYPSSSHYTRNWDKLVVEIKEEEKNEKLEGDAALNQLFQQIYSDGTDEVRRAMNKSFMESGGTVLSTNWSDVGKRKVEVNPPDDMEWKKF